MSKDNLTPFSEDIDEAKLHPNGWIYKFSKEYFWLYRTCYVKTR
jgi:hypothetical protein